MQLVRGSAALIQDSLDHSMSLRVQKAAMPELKRELPFVKILTPVGSSDNLITASGADKVNMSTSSMLFVGRTGRGSKEFADAVRHSVGDLNV